MMLLANIGITIEPPTPTHSDDVAFFTNAVLCLKKAGCREPCMLIGSRTALGSFVGKSRSSPQKLWLSLGYRASRAIREAFGLRPKRLATAVAEAEGEVLFGNTRLMAKCRRNGANCVGKQESPNHSDQDLSCRGNGCNSH